MTARRYLMGHAGNLNRSLAKPHADYGRDDNAKERGQIFVCKEKTLTARSNSIEGFTPA